MVTTLTTVTTKTTTTTTSLSASDSSRSIGNSAQCNSAKLLLLCLRMHECAYLMLIYLGVGNWCQYVNSYSSKLIHLIGAVHRLHRRHIWRRCICRHLFTQFMRYLLAHLLLGTHFTPLTETEASLNYWPININERKRQFKIVIEIEKKNQFIWMNDKLMCKCNVQMDMGRWLCLLLVACKFHYVLVGIAVHEKCRTMCSTMTYMHKQMSTHRSL